MSNILDPILGAIMFVVMAFSLLIGFVIISQLNSSGLMGVYATDANNFFAAMNNVAIFLVLAMALGSVVSAYLIKTNPVFFIVAVVLIFVQALIIPNVVIAFNQVAQLSTFSSAVSSLNLLVQLVQQLPIITIIFSGLAAIVGLMRS